MTIFVAAPCRVNAQSTAGNLWSRNMVWAHEMASYPLHLPSAPGDIYGSLYPLALDISSKPVSPTQTAQTDISSAQQAGVDAFDVDIFADATMIERYLDAADAFNQSAPAGQPPFLIAPCLDLSVLQLAGASDSTQEQAAFNAVTQYCALAAGHPSAARQQGALIIFNYGTSEMPVANWQDLRTRLAAAGCATYWVTDLGAPGLTCYRVFPAAEIAQYFPDFEAGFSFGPMGAYWDDVLSLFASYQEPFAGGMMPGYDREPAGSYSDASGTAVYRYWWQEHLQSGLTWAHVATWNDFSENTDIDPSSDWNMTRSDITAFYGAAFKHQSAPFAEPRLYVTTPQALGLGQNSVAEALVLNPLKKPVPMRIRLFDGNGNAVGNAVAGTALQGATAVSIPIDLTKLPACGFLRACARMNPGNQQLFVWSAPIIVFPNATNTLQGFSGSQSRILYYSVPMLAALPGTVGLSVSPSSNKTTAVATITPPAGAQVRFVELLHNAREVANFGAQGPFTISVPTGQVDIGGSVTAPDTNVSGYYVARVTDSAGRVGYSTPVYIP